MNTAIMGTDLSLASDRIIDFAPAFKMFSINKIILVYVLNLRSTMDFVEDNMDTAQNKLEEQKNKLLSYGFESDTSIVMGVPANELMRQVKIHDANLMIIGSRGHSWSKTSLGGTASETLHNMRCPVLLMAFNKQMGEKLQEEPMKQDLSQYEKFAGHFRKQEPKIELLHKTLDHHVLLTTDFSDFSENAFQWLKSHKDPIPKLTLMHIQDVVKIAKHLEDKLDEFNQIDTDRLERLRDEFLHNHPETKINIVLEYGNPKQIITQFIKDQRVSLTVMGSQGRGYLSEFFLGSVSLRVARQADSNVLIIPYSRKL